MTVNALVRVIYVFKTSSNSAHSEGDRDSSLRNENACITSTGYYKPGIQTKRITDCVQLFSRRCFVDRIVWVYRVKTVENLTILIILLINLIIRHQTLLRQYGRRKVTLKYSNRDSIIQAIRTICDRSSTRVDTRVYTCFRARRWTIIIIIDEYYGGWRQRLRVKYYNNYYGKENACYEYDFAAKKKKKKDYPKCATMVFKNPRSGHGENVYPVVYADRTV